MTNGKGAMDYKHILVVDDNHELTDALSEYLTKAGFIVDVAHNGNEMKQQFAVQKPDLIVLDIMLPGEDGFSLCAHIRKVSHVPIIMLTAITDEADRVAALEMGADDYVTKSFSPRELLARIKANLRRSSYAESSFTSRYFFFDQWCLDSITRKITGKNGEVKQLSGADFTLLNLFLMNRNSVLSRDVISQEIWRRETDPSSRTIDVQIARLRTQLNDHDRNIILTMRNKGYLLAVDYYHESA